MEGVIICDMPFDTPFSVNINDKHFYAHCKGKTEGDTFTHKISERKTPFHDVLLYALLHEEMHLVFDKTGIFYDLVHTPPVVYAMYCTMGFPEADSIYKQTKRTGE